MNLTKIDLKNILAVSKIYLTKNEEENIIQDLNNIINFFSNIKTIKLHNINMISPLEHKVFFKKINRHNNKWEKINFNIIKKNAPEYDKEHFLVPKVIE